MRTHTRSSSRPSPLHASWAVVGVASFALFLGIVGSTWSEDGARPGGSEPSSPPATPKAPEGATAPKEVYAGAQVCRECHVEEYRQWLGTSHARSFVSLQTATARRISEEPNAYAGMPSAKMMKECSPCHARGMDAAPAEREKGFHAEDGVQCEACHGPRGLHAKSKVGEVPGAKKGEDGVVMIARSKTAVLEQCMDCHKEKPSHAVLRRPAFDFETYWKKVAHGHLGGEARK